MKSQKKKKGLSKTSPFVVTIDGKKVKSYVDFVYAMQREFCFPRDCLGSVDRYLDWMRDLSWINADEIIVKIKYSSSFMIDNPQEKKIVLSDFNDIIIPFWESDSNSIIANGVTKKVKLYLIP